jgi:hypothetical protein
MGTRPGLSGETPAEAEDAVSELLALLDAEVLVAVALLELRQLGFAFGGWVQRVR